MIVEEACRDDRALLLCSATKRSALLAPTRRPFRTSSEDDAPQVGDLPQRVDAALGDGPGDDALLDLLGALEFRVAGVGP